MRNISTKVDGVDSLAAGDFNATEDEIETVATTAGITIDPAGGPNTDLTMLSQATANYVAGGMIYDDSGSINSVVLSRSGTLADISGYKDNQIFVFKPAANNAGATTVNVAGKGVKNLTNNGAPLVTGELNTNFYTVIRYELTGDRFEIVNINTQNLTAHNVIIDTTGGNFTSLEAYFLSTPVAGDRVLVKNNQAITSTLAFPANIKIEFAPGVIVTSSGVMNPVIQVGANVQIPNLDLTVDTSAGVIPNVITYVIGATGSKIGKLTVNITGPSGVTALVSVPNGADDNLLHGSVTGSVTNVFSGAGYGSTLGLSNDFKVSRSNVVHINNARSIGAGEGIDFSNVGTLEQILTSYQSGTYVPVVTPLTSGSYSLTGSLQFVKIGALVKVSGRIVVVSQAAPVGIVSISLPPFAAVGITSVGNAILDGHGGLLTGQTFLDLSGSTGSGIFRTVNDSGVVTAIDASTLTASFGITLDFSYVSSV